MCPVNNKAPLVKILASCQAGGWPISELIMTHLLGHTNVNWPQWVILSQEPLLVKQDLFRQWFLQHNMHICGFHRQCTYHHKVKRAQFDQGFLCLVFFPDTNHVGQHDWFMNIFQDNLHACPNTNEATTMNITETSHHRHSDCLFNSCSGW